MEQALLNFSGGFLYFPEDKSLYIPAAIEITILLIIVFRIYFFKRFLAVLLFLEFIFLRDYDVFRIYFFNYFV